ncbi:MAG: hypothetical protein HXY34_06175 [Candidatus Thorarchaeota archaeon]|nr:hypothetical protein [Candidatus Thorarchaeota archaeon]
MAFGLINYGFAIVLLCALACLAALLRRYIMQRNNLTLVFSVFMTGYATTAATYTFRGFYSVGEPMELLLWIIQNYMYIVMVVPLALFLIYPLLQQRKGQKSYWSVMGLVVVILIVAVFNALMIQLSAIEYTYTDNYGLPHYALEFPVGSGSHLVYYLTLILDVAVSTISLVLLAISYKREADPFYKRKSLLLVVGWTIATYGQLLLLGPSLAIFNPFTSVAAALLVAAGVLMSKKA